MKVFVLFITLLLNFAFVFGQDRRYSTTNKDAIALYSLANQNIQDHLYTDAVLQLKKALELDDKFIEAHMQMAEIYRIMRVHSIAITQYTRVLELNPEFNRMVYFKLGDEEVHEGKYEKALKDLEKYISYPKIFAKNMQYAQKLIADCKFSLKAIANPVLFKPENLGPEVNTADDEYLPVTTADEGTLIFTRKIAENEDFYKSNKVNGKWRKAWYLSDQINTPQYNEGAQSLSQDGKFLFFTGCNRPDGLGRCDIYVSQRKSDDWSKPFNPGSPLNTAGWEAQPSISANGRTLYFVSNRKGGYGGYDIWKSNLTDKGWTEPENLGPNINTAYDEQSPFIHADDSTLYFCSNGWPGLGGMDLFVSRLGKDGKWQKSENLGYPINTNGDESGLTVTASGERAYFSSNKLSGFGGYDIYTFDLPPKLRPHLVTYVKGIVKDAKTKDPLEAAVEIIDLDKDNPVYQDFSDQDQGSFLATIINGKNYGLNISKSGYLFYSENFSLVGYDGKKPFDILVLLKPIEIGSKVILTNIFFDTNHFDLKKESIGELDKLVEFLNLNSTLHIEISGHTDDVGNDDSNQILSENRAKAVYQYLIANNINPDRLVFKGYGKTQPIASNVTEIGRSVNRRTEFKVIAK